MKHILWIIALFCCSANAASLSEGSFKGTSEGENVQMMLKKVPGSDGSFYALLVKGFGWQETIARLYIVTPFRSSVYGMTPLEITSMGLIGVKDPDPVFKLSVTQSGSRKTMNIDQNNRSGRRDSAFSSRIKFSGERSQSNWLELNTARIGGYYGDYHESNTLELTDFDLRTRNATANFQSKILGGSYLLAENWSNMLLLRASTLFASGEEIERMPEFIGVFIKNCAWECTQQLLLLDSRNRNNSKVFVINKGGDGARIAREEKIRREDPRSDEQRECESNGGTWSDTIELCEEEY